MKKKYILAFIAYLTMSVLCLAFRLLFRYGIIYTENGRTLDFIWSILSQIIAMAGVPLLIVMFLGKEKTTKSAADINTAVKPAIDKAGTNLADENSANGNRYSRGKYTKESGENIQSTDYSYIKPMFKEMGFRKPKLYMVLLSIVIGFLFNFATIGISYINQIFLILTGFRIPVYADEPLGGAGMFLLSIIGTAVLPGICEEIMHRGILVRGMRGRHSETKIILITTLLFSFMHTNILQTLYTFAGGIVLGILAVKTKNIYPAMIIHFVNNALSVIYDYSGDFLYNVISALGLGAIVFWGLSVIGIIFIVRYILKRNRADNILAAVQSQKTQYMYDPYTGKFIGNINNTNGQVKIETIRYDSETGRPIVVKTENVNVSENKDTKAVPRFDPQTGAPLNNSQPQASSLAKDAEIKYKDAGKKVPLTATTLLYCSVVLNGLLTIFTLIWGLV